LLSFIIPHSSFIISLSCPSCQSLLIISSPHAGGETLTPCPSLSATAPEEVNWDTRCEDDEADGAVGRILVDGRGDDERARGDEERRREGVAGHSEADARVADSVALNIHHNVALVNINHSVALINCARSRVSSEDEERGGGQA